MAEKITRPKTSRQADAIYWELINRYKKDKGNEKFVLVEYSDSHDLSSLYKNLNESKRYRRKSFHITDIKPISSDKIVSYAFGIQPMKRKKDKVIVKDMTGLFKVTFSDGDIMYYAKWITGGGKARAVDGMFATERHIWAKFLRMLNKEIKKRSKPKIGIYRIFNNGGILQYAPKKDLLETPIVHPSIKDIVDDMEFYYNNVEIFTRNKQAGMRKIMLIGEPGTGKSSLCFKLARLYGNKKSTVFATSIGDIASHTGLCAKYKISTLAFLEDAESSLQNADSNVFNYLDGVDQPRNLAGAYIIMTTNHPQRIEPRILKRPGRVDRIITFGALEGNDALECARIYFDDFLPIKRFNENGNKIKLTAKQKREMEKLEEDLAQIVNGMTGAQIKEVSNASAAFAVSLRRNVDIEIIKEVKKRMKESLKKAEDYAKDYSLEETRQRLGFKMKSDETVKPLELYPGKEVHKL